MNRLEQEILAAGSPLRTTQDGFEKSFTFPHSFIGFDGHFPDGPILAGVIQLIMGSLSVNEAAQTQFTIQTVSKAKFLKPVAPDEQLKVTGRLSNKKDKTVATVAIYSDDQMVSTFCLALSQETA